MISPWARQLSGEGLGELTQEEGFIQAGNSLLNAPVAARWQRKVLNTLATYHQQHQDEPGPGRERLRRMALPMEDEALVLLLIEKMRESGAIKSHHGWLHLPEHKAGFTAEQEAIWQKAASLFGDEPWWVRDLARETHTDEQTMRQVLRHAAQQGLIVAIVKDRYYRNDRILAFANLIRDRGSGAGVNLCGGLPRPAERGAQAGDSDPRIFQPDRLYASSGQRSSASRRAAVP
ncbi:selenocysteinyl-tRNA-specific translation factor [Enterobacter cancerogenus]|uniref:Selenocysteinyl-tRNA-specific translation factor n=1 Tax=Enterobacter cancerogenus TaxID=69218 RepID=A0A484XRJ2_9ENTR|nr:selenocysteinyl-tRNA-specific translation factor [Enterobacter cancerogenus]